MNSRQASILSQASELLQRTAAKDPSPTPKAAVLWKYVDPEGNPFYLEVKKATIKSPFSGKSFSAKPTKHTPAQVGMDMKDEMKGKEPKTASIDPWKA